ncbi:high mobility group box domain-containing protein, partial [Mycena filopes]
MSSSTSANTPHIPRPPNAFMIFRSQFIQDEREVLRLQGRSDTSRMQDISRAAGQQWRAMNGEARRPFFEQADEAKRMHGLRHPDYVFRP